MTPLRYVVVRDDGPQTEHGSLDQARRYLGDWPGRIFSVRYDKSGGGWGWKYVETVVDHSPELPTLEPVNHTAEAIAQAQKPGAHRHVDPGPLFDETARNQEEMF
jgi:hypothetical protein